jgi:hypothetical protein
LIPFGPFTSFPRWGILQLSLNSQAGENKMKATYFLDECCNKTVTVNVALTEKQKREWRTYQNECNNNNAERLRTSENIVPAEIDFS